MKSLLVATAVAALAVCFAGSVNAAPAVGGLDGVHAGSSLVKKTGYYHRHRHCVWRHGHRHCWWGR
jgi:hypothetical protein